MSIMYYLARWHDSARIERQLKAKGLDPDEGDNWFEECNLGDDRKRCGSLKEAEAFLVGIIKAHKDAFGSAEIQQIVKMSNRCQYCVCGGSQSAHRYIVDDTGICDDHPEESWC